MHPEPAASLARGLVPFRKSTMHKKTYTLPTLSPKLTMCPNGCLHLQLGPASIHISEEGLRDLAKAATHLLEHVDAQKRPPIAEKDLH